MTDNPRKLSMGVSAIQRELGRIRQSNTVQNRME